MKQRLVWCILGSLSHQALSSSSSLSTEKDWEERLKAAKLGLWVRGAYDFSSDVSFPPQEGDIETRALQLEEYAQQALLRQGPVREARKSIWQEHMNGMPSSNDEAEWWMQIRGGSGQETMEASIARLGVQFGPEFLAAIEQNKADHRADCEASCEMFYCASKENDDSRKPPLEKILNEDETRIHSYSMGAVPPEDFARDFGFPLDLIKVTEGAPLFSKQEARNVVEMAEAEGVSNNEYPSGKYRLGGDYLTNLPDTRAWFNEKLRDTLFPLLSHLFPEVIESPAVLRAHSVSLLKYNSSHPRTDIHIDNGILAMTLAMTPLEEYQGGGTFFEHFDKILPMDVGHGTFRPGSVRHGGHRVTSGTRYILGAFLLIEDRVEHVRRLKNRGSALRRTGDLAGAEQYFKWALGLNQQCTTCLKDWAEILYKRGDLMQAEEKLRKALDLLENKDSDALFTLGLVLSEQGRDDESISAYKQSVELNKEDAELLYNLACKFHAVGQEAEELKMYERATRVDPKFGDAWLNWGTSLAEKGNFDDAEQKFLQALHCQASIAPKAMINLALVYHRRAGSLAQSGDLPGALKLSVDAANLLDTAQPLLKDLVASGNQESVRYLSQYEPLRLQAYALIGNIHAGSGDLAASEQEFRKATKIFPESLQSWQLLGRVLEVQGKTEEVQAVKSKLNSLIGK